jgi:hypothetical protein
MLGRISGPVQGNGARRNRYNELCTLFKKKQKLTSHKNWNCWKRECGKTKRRWLDEVNKNERKIGIRR